MENEIMVNNATGEVIDTPAKSPLDNLPTSSIDDFRRDAFRGNMSRLAKIAHEKGDSDVVLHAGDQLTTEQVVGHVLTIIAVQYAHVPDDNGEQKMYPVAVFAEAPGYWYNLGQLATNMVADWAAELGDDPNEDPNLPLVNQELTDCGGVRVYFRWKQGKNRRYVSITVA